MPDTGEGIAVGALSECVGGRSTDRCTPSHDKTPIQAEIDHPLRIPRGSGRDLDAPLLRLQHDRHAKAVGERQMLLGTEVCAKKTSTIADVPERDESGEALERQHVADVEAIRHRIQGGEHAHRPIGTDERHDERTLGRDDAPNGPHGLAGDAHASLGRADEDAQLIPKHPSGDPGAHVQLLQQAEVTRPRRGSHDEAPPGDFTHDHLRCAEHRRASATKEAEAILPRLIRDSFPYPERPAEPIGPPPLMICHEACRSDPNGRCKPLDEGQPSRIDALRSARKEQSLSEREDPEGRSVNPDLDNRAISNRCERRPLQTDEATHRRGTTDHAQARESLMHAEHRARHTERCGQDSEELVEHAVR